MSNALLCLLLSKEDDIIAVTTKGTVCRQQIANISVQRRVSQGVKIIKLDDSDMVEAVAKVIKENDTEEGTDTPPVQETIDKEN